MKKILFIEGIYPINTRSKRIIESLKKKYEVKVVAWDRLNSYFEETDILSIYHSKEGYGNKIKKLLGMYKYFKFIKYINTKYNPNIIFVSQWDMLIFGSILKKENQKLFYDNIDMPSNSSVLIEKTLKYIEKKCIKKCDGIIFASRFFKENYSFFTKYTYILENLPLRNNYMGLATKRSQEYQEKIILAFIGTTRYFDILKNIVDSVGSKEFLEFHFFGTGPDEIKIKEYCQKKKYRNIYFFGKYNYENIEEIYNKVEIVWAAYPNRDSNVKYAISNKFFESIVYEKPMFFSEKTRLGELVENEKLGFVINPYDTDRIFNELDYYSLIEKIKDYKENIKKYKKNSILFWEEKEEEFLETFEENT